MDVTKQGLSERKALINQKIGTLAYERLTLAKRVDEIDALIPQYEAMLQENDSVRKDITTDTAIAEAKAKEAKEAKEDEKQSKETP